MDRLIELELKAKIQEEQVKSSSKKATFEKPKEEETKTKSQVPFQKTHNDEDDDEFYNQQAKEFDKIEEIKNRVQETILDKVDYLTK